MMNQKKELNLSIKKSSLKIVGKYLLVILCCFIVAIIYPFINIYCGKYDISFIGKNPNSYTSLVEWELDRVTLRTSLDEEYRILYSSRHGSSSIFFLWKYFDLNSFSSPTYKKFYSLPNRDERETIEKWFKEQTSIFTSIKLIFAFDDYKAIFWWTFLPLLIATILLMNFKFNINLKNE